jgi:hypothetical protein
MFVMVCPCSREPTIDTRPTTTNAGKFVCRERCWNIVFRACSEKTRFFVQVALRGKRDCSEHKEKQSRFAITKELAHSLLHSHLPSSSVILRTIPHTNHSLLTPQPLYTPTSLFQLPCTLHMSTTTRTRPSCNCHHSYVWIGIIW